MSDVYVDRLYDNLAKATLEFIEKEGIDALGFIEVGKTPREVAEEIENYVKRKRK